MAGTENPYEPKLQPIAGNDVPADSVNHDQPSALDYSQIMRASDQGVQPRDQTSLIDRPKIDDIKDADIQKAITLSANAAAAAQLMSLLQSGQPDNASTGMVDGQGNPVSFGRLKKALVEDLRKNSDITDFNDPAKLRDYVGKTTDQALTISKSTLEKYEAASRATDKNVNARNELAKQLGFVGTNLEVPDGKGGKTTVTTYDINPQDIQTRIAQSTNEQEKANLQKLSGLLTNYDSIQKERNALSMVDVSAAQMMMSGLTHKVGAQTLEGLPATREEVMRAYELMHIAGRSNPQLETTPQFQTVKDQSTAMYSDIQLQRSKDAVTALQAADKLRVDGKPEAEVTAAYEAALAKVKEVDMATIRTNLQSQEKEFIATKQKFDQTADTPENQQIRMRMAQELQSRQDIALQLAQIMQVGKEVKTQYATYLNEQGKNAQAVPLLASVIAETPEFCTPDKDPTFQQQYEKAMNGASLNTEDTEKHRTLFENAKAAGDWTTAEKELGILKGAAQTANDNAINGTKDRLAEFEKRKQALTTELADLQKNQTMDEAAKETRATQINNELKGYETLGKSLSESLPKMEDASNVQMHSMDYMKAVILTSKGDEKDAHDIFDRLKREAPEIANNKDYHLDDLLEATRHKNWLERHYDSIVTWGKIGLATLAAGAAIVLTAGAATPLVIAAAAGAGAAGYFAGGAAGHFGAKGLGYKSTDNYNNWRPGQDLLTGAAIGASMGAGHALFAGGGLAAAGGRMLALGEAAESPLASFAWNAGGNALRVTASAGTFVTTAKGAAITAGAFATGHQGYEMAFKGKSFGDAVVDGGIETAGIFGGLYGGGRLGMGTFTGSAAFGAGVSGEQQLIAMRHGKSFSDASADFLKNGIDYSMYAFGAGTLANMEAAAALGKYGVVTANSWGAVPGAALRQVGAQGKFILGDGMGMSLAGKGMSRYFIPAAATAYVGYNLYSENDAYNQSRTPKPWVTDDKRDDMRRALMAQQLTQGKRIVKPVVATPEQ